MFSFSSMVAAHLDDINRVDKGDSDNGGSSCHTDLLKKRRWGGGGGSGHRLHGLGLHAHGGEVWKI